MKTQTFNNFFSSEGFSLLLKIHIELLGGYDGQHAWLTTVFTFTLASCMRNRNS